MQDKTAVKDNKYWGKAAYKNKDLFGFCRIWFLPRPIFTPDLLLPQIHKTDVRVYTGRRKNFDRIAILTAATHLKAEKFIVSPFLKPVLGYPLAKGPLL